MKKTIAAVAIIAASSTGFALSGPGQIKPKRVCLSVQSTEDKSQYVASCDQTANNAQLGKKLAANGCAEGQAALVTYQKLNIGLCMPPGAVQL